MEMKQARILANVFLKNAALFGTPKSSKESGTKMLKAFVNK